MNKNILAPLFFIVLVLTLMYNIDDSNKKIDNFFILHKKIANINATNKNFDIFTANNIKYKNFDYIQKDIAQSKADFNFISENELFNSLENKSLKILFFILKDDMKIKIDHLYRIISNTAVLNNSFRYMQKVQQNLDNKELIYIYTQMVGLNYNSEIDANDLNQRIYKYNVTNENEELFISHAKIILQYYFTFEKLQEKIQILKINEKLSIFEKEFNRYSTTIITDLKDIIWLLTALIFISLIIFLYNNHTMAKKQAELNRFKKAVENSDNIILITDKQQKIKYVNEAFETTTGYTLKDVIGKSPALLKSYQKSESFYDELKETILAGKKWKGEFINKNKDGKITFEKASITPILDEDGQVEEYLAIKLDITKEKETHELLREKERLLSQQSKMLAMREMLESIAHQWRQPLSTISTAASGVSLSQEYGNLSDEQLSESMEVVVENTQYLSKTIDNFRNYFNTKNERTSFDLEETMHKVIDLVGYKLNESKVGITLHCDKVFLEGLENEFIQAMVNIINNSLDAFNKIQLDKKMIFITILKEKNSAIVQLKDNAGGLDDETLGHVFEPYFTTKHQSTGTGMGLYIVYEIISEHFKGTIDIYNTQYLYEKNNCKGAEISITLPISSINKKIR